MKFSSKLDTLFLDPNSVNRFSGIASKKFNIILSPSLYWVKKLSLPVKYVRDVRKLLPSLFEDTLPSGNYSYSVYKSEDEFFIFAYENKLILETLSLYGIALSNVSNVYFAQSEMQNIQGAIKINETQSVYVKNDIVVLVPCCWIEEGGDLNLSDINLSKHKVALQQYGHIVDNSSLYKIGAILLVLSVLIFSEYLITTQKTAQILELKEELFTKYKLKSTTLQNKSMLKKYKNIHIKQTKLREYISYVLSLSLRGKERLSKLNLKSTTLNAEFINASDGTIARIKRRLKAKNVKEKIDMKETTLHLEIVL